MEQKTYQVVTSDDKEPIFELRSVSHWCQQCLLFVYDMMSKKVYSTPHSGEIKLLRQSLASGCHMCEMILDRCRPDQQDFYTTDWKSEWDGVYAYTEHRIKIRQLQFDF